MQNPMLLLIKEDIILSSSKNEWFLVNYFVSGSLLEAENSDHIGDHKVEEMQLVQPQFQET